MPTVTVQSSARLNVQITTAAGRRCSGAATVQRASETSSEPLLASAANQIAPPSTNRSIGTSRSSSPDPDTVSTETIRSRPLASEAWTTNRALPEQPYVSCRFTVFTSVQRCQKLAGNLPKYVLVWALAPSASWRP